MRVLITLLAACCVLALAHSEDAVAPLADEALDLVVPEQAPEALAQDDEDLVQDTVLAQDDAVAQDGAAQGAARKGFAWDTTDDEMDHEAMMGRVKADSLGNNPITGQPMSKGHLGMTDHHLEYDETMHRDFVKNPGYTTQDTSTEDGHYYLGSGRRRIGAGFGRRRRAVEIPQSKAEINKEIAVHKMLSDPDSLRHLLRFAHSRTSAYAEDATKDRTATIEALKTKAKNLMEGMTRQQLERFSRELLGLQSGPTFFTDYNYKGDSLTTHVSLSDISKSGKITNNDITSLKVPAGYEVELFTEKDYSGQSLVIAGPTTVWSLSKTPLTLHGGINSGGSGGHGMTVQQGYLDYKTTWDNQAMSIKITKYAYTIYPSKKKCTTLCGVDDYHYTGSIGCQRTGGLQSKTVVWRRSAMKTDTQVNHCDRLKLSQPKLPKRRCQGTALCTMFKTSKPTAKCTTTCGFKGDTKYGKVWCELRHRHSSDPVIPSEATPSKVADGKHVTDGKCDYWNLPRPATPTKKCPATTRCVHWVQRYMSKCGTSCGTAASWIYTSNFCVADRGGASAAAGECHHWKKPVPATNRRKCHSTARCVKWTQQWAYGCPTACGTGASTISTRNVCEALSGGAAAPSECQAWGLGQPAAKTSGCAATGRCPKPSGSCCTLVSKWASANSCGYCAGGHHFEWAWTCGGSRACD